MTKLEKAYKQFLEARQQYSQQLEKDKVTGNEFQLRTPLQNFLQPILEIKNEGKQKKDPNLLVVHHQPSVKIKSSVEGEEKTETKHPDFGIFFQGMPGSYRVFIETKKLSRNVDKLVDEVCEAIKEEKPFESLDEEAKRIYNYSKKCNNIVVTNYKEFIWIFIEREASSPKIQKKILNLFPSKNEDAKSEENCRRLEYFFSSAIEKGNTTAIARLEELARNLAPITRSLKTAIAEILGKESKTAKNSGELYRFYKTLNKSLFDGVMKQETFSDTLAQLLVFSMLIAKLETKENFKFESLRKKIPQSFPLIKDMVWLFERVEGKPYKDLQETLERALEFINRVDVDAAMKTLDKTRIVSGKENYVENDSFLYFYEPFLKSYDEKMRKEKGVYYTPPAIVDCIVRNTHWLLQQHFGKRAGLAEEDVKLLDFSCGTGAFLLQAYRQVWAQLVGSGEAGENQKADFLKIASKNLNGFEIMPAAYVVAHLRLHRFLKEKGIDIDNNEEAKRLPIYLTNTLKAEIKNKDDKGDDGSIEKISNGFIDENKKATYLKKEERLLVVMGNPPYNVKSTNKLDDFKEVKNTHDNYKPKNEKKQNLDDDYIKFLAFAHQRIAAHEQGIVAVVTNNSYLGGITHRKMRLALLAEFDRVYIADLHGNATLRELTPEGGKDENLFAIKQGVAIAFFVKLPPSKGGKRKEEGTFDRKKRSQMSASARNKINDITEKYIKLKDEAEQLGEKSLKERLAKQERAEKNEVKREDRQEADNDEVFALGEALAHTKVYHRDLYGRLADKTDALLKLELSTMEELPVQERNDQYGKTRSGKRYTEPLCYLTRREDLGWETYANAFGLPEMVRKYSSGIETQKDNFCIAFTKTEMKKRRQALRDLHDADSADKSAKENKVRNQYNLQDTPGWKLKQATKCVGKPLGELRRVLYRPFDIRFTYYTAKSKAFLSRPRYEILKHLLAGGNWAIGFTRAEYNDKANTMFLVNNLVSDCHTFGGKCYYAPLYRVFPFDPYEAKKLQADQDSESLFKKEKDGDFNFQEPKEKFPNFSDAYIENLQDHYGVQLYYHPHVENPQEGSWPSTAGPIYARWHRPTSLDEALEIAQKGRCQVKSDHPTPISPEHIFGYTYGMLRTPGYQKNYLHFLRADFPRVPLVEKKDDFFKIADLGYRLALVQLAIQPGDGATNSKKDTWSKTVLAREIDCFKLDANIGDCYPEKGKTPNYAVKKYRQSERYKPEDKKMYINETIYFRGVEQAVYDYAIGNKCVLEDYLKDRARNNIVLEPDDRQHLQQVIKILTISVRLQSQLQQAYSEIFPASPTS